MSYRAGQPEDTLTHTTIIPPQPLSFSARPSSPNLLAEHGKAHQLPAILPGTDLHGVVCAVRQSLCRSGFLWVNGPRHSPAKIPTQSLADLAVG